MPPRRSTRHGPPHMLSPSSIRRLCSVVAMVLRPLGLLKGPLRLALLARRDHSIAILGTWFTSFRLPVPLAGLSVLALGWWDWGSWYAIGRRRQRRWSYASTRFGDRFGAGAPGADVCDDRRVLGHPGAAFATMAPPRLPMRCDSVGTGRTGIRLGRPRRSRRRCSFCRGWTRRWARSHSAWPRRCWRR
jgi:hypothetical protein